jgi:hypothetical protein
MCIVARTLSCIDADLSGGRLRLSGGLLPRDRDSAGLLRDMRLLSVGERAFGGRAKEGLRDRNVSKHEWLCYINGALYCGLEIVAPVSLMPAGKSRRDNDYMRYCSEVRQSIEVHNVLGIVGYDLAHARVNL